MKSAKVDPYLIDLRAAIQLAAVASNSVTAAVHQLVQKGEILVVRGLLAELNSHPDQIVTRVTGLLNGVSSASTVPAPINIQAIIMDKYGAAMSGGIPGAEIFEHIAAGKKANCKVVCADHVKDVYFSIKQKCELKKLAILGVKEFSAGLTPT